MDLRLIIFLRYNINFLIKILAEVLRYDEFQAIQEQMLLNGANPVNFEDVKDEIFDMVRPADPTKITLKDLISSGYGGTAISILIEFQYFLAYEHREILAAVSPD